MQRRLAGRTDCGACQHKITSRAAGCTGLLYTVLESVHFKELHPRYSVILFQMCPCPNCGGALKPIITFFGDNVSLPVVDSVYQRLAEADRMLVVGSSLHVSYENENDVQARVQIT